MPPSAFTGPATRLTALGTVIAAAVLAAAPHAGAAAAAPPHYDHVVIVMEENHSYSDIIGDTADAPYLNSLAGQGASFTNSFAIEHPSQPNYLDLFSGDNQGVTDDSCPNGPFDAANQASELEAAGLTFSGYAEDLPADGATDCTAGDYARKHAPWTNFSNVPATDSKTFSEFPTDYTQLPTVSWVIPNLQDDMHDGTITQADSWLQNNIDSYAQWAASNNSLLIVTWDEDDYSQSNQIPTLLYGAHVTPGTYSEQIDHYSVLRTIEDMYDLTPTGNAAQATAITDAFT